MQKLFPIFVLCLSLLPAQVTSRSVIYDAPTDLVIRPLPPTPPMGPAGTVIKDPIYGNPILRATDTGCVTPGAAQQNSWNANSTKFYVLCSGMTVVAYEFDGANMRATRIPGTISLGAPSFSYTDPNLLYGRGQGNLSSSTLYEYNFATKQYTPIIDVSKIVPSFRGGMGSTSISANDWLTIDFDGIQDTYHYCLYINVRTKQYKLLDTHRATVDGKPVTFDGQAPGFGLHLVNIDKSGRFVVLSKGDGQSGPNLLIWDTSNDTFRHLWPYGTGHNSLGWGYAVNGNGLAGYYMQWFLRPLDNPEAWTKMAPDVTTGGYGYKEEHTSWNNARPDKFAPVILALTRQSWSPNPPGPWDDEILGVSTEPNRPLVYRFGHTWALFDNTDFWDLPRGNVSPDGRYFKFTSNWRRTINNKQDVFIIKLPLREDGGGSTQPPAKTATSTTLTSSANPSSVGQAITLQARVTPQSATGTVKFLVGGVAIGTAGLNGGIATYSTASLSVGQHSITAAYSGDANHNASVSAVLTQTVQGSGGSTNPPPASYTPGMIANGGFEDGTTGWAGFGGSATIDSVAASGSRSARIAAESGAERSIRQDVRVYSGVYYTLAAVVRTAGARSAARIDWLNSSGQVIGSTALPVVSGNTDWKAIAGGAFSPAGAYTARIVLAAAAGSGSLWYDQVSFAKGDPPQNPAPSDPPPVNPPPANPPPVSGNTMLTNGGFENGTEPWTGFGDGAAIDSTTFAAGTKSVRIAAATGPERSVSQQIRVYSGVYYTLAAYVKTAGAVSAARIDWLNSSGQFIASTVLPVESGNTDWKLIAAGNYAPPSAYTARIVLAAAPGQGTIWYDEAGFFKGELPSGALPSDPQGTNPGNPPVAPPDNYNAGLVVNGGFESGTRPWDGLGGQGGTLDSTVFLEGSNSAKVTAASSERSIEQTIEVYSGVKYTLTCFVQTAGARSLVRIDWQDLSGRVLSSTRLPEVSGNTSWKQISASEFAPPGARRARIVLGTAAGSGSAWFDMVSFAK